MDSKNKTTSVSATQELRAIFQIDNTSRQAAWYSRLINCLPHAVFTSGEPEIIFNPAGLTYYNLEFAEPTTEEDSTLTRYTIPELIDTFLVNEGVGISIEAHNPKHAIDLSYGDILGFHLYRTFAEPEDHPFKTEHPQPYMIRKGTDILISDVPEHILPTTAVKLLEEIMQHFGIKDAKVKLLYLPETGQHDLIFSIDKNQFNPSTIHTLIQKLGWFLPRYYSYLACDLNDVFLLVDTH